MTISEAPMSPFAPPPVTLAEVNDYALAMHRRTLEAQGVFFTDADLDELSTELASIAETFDASLLAQIHTDPAELAVVVRRRLVQKAMTAVGARMKAEGRTRQRATLPVDPAAEQAGLEPTIWSNGVVLQRALATALMELDELAAAASLDDNPSLTHVMGLGMLFTDTEVAEIFKLDESILRTWRSRRAHFEFLKFPGKRGAIRYTERGLRAFIERNLTPTIG